ncbi:MAG: RING finger protein [Candidatus Caldarchaeum sp.]
MIVSEQRLLVRFFKLGSLLALVGSMHILTLLLPWYVVRADTVSRSLLSGYLLTETLMFSVAGGMLAGLSLLATSFSSRAGTVRIILAAFSILGGVLALLSPVYLSMVALPRLNVSGEPDLGFFAALFTAVVLMALGLVVVLTRPQRVEVPYPQYYGEQEPLTSSSVPEETSLERVENVEDETVCPICYTTVTAENAVRCSSCGVVFHQGCAEAYVNINGTCPNCGKTVL